jgi:hypothetical protein
MKGMSFVMMEFWGRTSVESLAWSITCDVKWIAGENTLVHDDSQGPPVDTAAKILTFYHLWGHEVHSSKA